MKGTVGVRSIGKHAITQEGEEQEGKEKKKKKTDMDSCMPSTGAEEDSSECLRKALAWRGHHNP